MLVEKMPEILGAAAGELRQANVTILNGSAGLGDLVAGLAAQATSILEIVRKGNGKAADVFAASLSAGVSQEPGAGPPAG
jgi:flotillin